MLVLEDIHSGSKRKLFRWLGIDWLATPYAWLSIPFYVSIGLAVVLLGRSPRSVGGRVCTGIVYGFILIGMNVIHTIGHILSGKTVGAPMKANLVTATFHVNLYPDDPPSLPPRIHLRRALGGPLLNILVGSVALLINSLNQVGWVRFFGLANCIVALWCLLPLPGLDGSVLMKNLFRKP
jgi:Zn-dependent protease